MGTSKSFPTPSGGAWSPLKNDISDMLGGNRNIQPDRIIGGTIRAAGLAPASLGGGERRGRSGGAGGGGGGQRSGRASVGRAAAGLAGFGAAVQAGGLDAGLHVLGLEELHGKPAAEIIARISDHLAEGVEDLQGELLRTALREAMFEAAALGGDPGLRDMGTALQNYLDQTGPEGLAELFLSHFVFDRIWLVVESHVDQKADGNSSASAMAMAVQNACRSHVRSHMDDARNTEMFNKLNWFGPDGIRIGQQIVATLESRLAAL